MRTTSPEAWRAFVIGGAVFLGLAGAVSAQVPSGAAAGGTSPFSHVTFNSDLLARADRQQPTAPPPAAVPDPEPLMNRLTFSLQWRCEGTISAPPRRSQGGRTGCTIS